MSEAGLQSVGPSVNLMCACVKAVCAQNPEHPLHHHDWAAEEEV